MKRASGAGNRRNGNHDNLRAYLRFPPNPAIRRVFSFYDIAFVRKMTLMLHHFTLPIPADLTDELADAMYAAGCDDATLSRRGGVTYADFSREAPTLAEAVAGAKAAIERALARCHSACRNKNSTQLNPTRRHSAQLNATQHKH